MMLELTDALSIFNNGMQTFTREIVRTGSIKNTGITFEFLGGDSDPVFCSCKVDNSVTSILLTPEPSLPSGETRDKFEFLFEDTNGSAGKWKLENTLTKDEKDYSFTNFFHDSYSESPLRDFIEKNGLEAKFYLYFAEQQDNVEDGLAIFELGHNLKTNSGILYFYNFRLIPNSDTQYL